MFVQNCMAAEHTIDGWIHNNCPFDLYAWTDAVKSACDAPPCSSEQWVIKTGTTYKVPFSPPSCPKPDPGGITVKLSRHAFNKYVNEPGHEIYQLEYSINCDWLLFYNLSHENARRPPVPTGEDFNPLKDLARYVQVGPKGACDAIWCAPGDDSCDWWADGPPTVQHNEFNVNNCTAMDINMWIC